MKAEISGRGCTPSFHQPRIKQQHAHLSKIRAHTLKQILLSKIRNINPNILENINSQITQFFLYEDKDFTASTNFIILN